MFCTRFWHHFHLLRMRAVEMLPNRPKRPMNEPKTLISSSFACKASPVFSILPFFQISRFADLCYCSTAQTTCVHFYRRFASSEALWRVVCTIWAVTASLPLEMTAFFERKAKTAADQTTKRSVANCGLASLVFSCEHGYAQ